MEEQVCVFFTSLPFKCHKLSRVLADLIWTMDLAFHAAEALPSSALTGARRHRDFPWGPQPGRRQPCHGVKLHPIQQLPSVNTYTALASESQDPVTPDPCCGEGSHSPFHLDPNPIISPSLTQSNQRPTVTFKTGWLALLFLTTGTIEFIRKYH